MYWVDMEWARSFDMGLTSAEGKKLERFKWTANIILKTTMKILKPHYVVKSCWHLISPGLSLCVYYDLYVIGNVLLHQTPVYFFFFFFFLVLGSPVSLEMLGNQIRTLFICPCKKLLCLLTAKSCWKLMTLGPWLWVIHKGFYTGKLRHRPIYSSNIYQIFYRLII